MTGLRFKCFIFALQRTQVVRLILSKILLFRLVDHLALAQDSANTGEASVNPAWAEYVASGRYHHRGYTIAGGSSEVQHNIIAKQVLEL